MSEVKAFLEQWLEDIEDIDELPAWYVKDKIKECLKLTNGGKS